MKLKTRDRKRGGIWAAVTFVIVTSIMVFGGQREEVGALLVNAIFFSTLAYLVGSRATDKGVLRRATALAKTVVPGFTVSNHLMGIERQSGLLMDEHTKSLLIFDDGGKRCSVVPESALLGSELIEDGTTVSTISTDRVSQLAGAAVGGLVFGGVGAVVGALSGKKTSRSKPEISEVTLRLTVNDRRNASFRVQLFKLKKPVARDSRQGRKMLQRAEEADALIAVIIGQSATA